MAMPMGGDERSGEGEGRGEGAVFRLLSDHSVLVLTKQVLLPICLDPDIVHSF